MCKYCKFSDRDLEAKGWGSHAVQRLRDTIAEERGEHD